MQINKVMYICRKFFHRIRFLRFSVSGSCETATNFFCPYHTYPQQQLELFEELKVQWKITGDRFCIVAELSMESETKT